MWVGHLHAIDFHEDEVIQLIDEHGSIQLCNHFANCSSFSGARCPGNVDTRTRTGSDGPFEMGIDFGKLVFATWKSSWHGRHVQLIPSYLIRRRQYVRRED